ncbi:MAG TPA: galactokinase, partial [Acidimicrobiia bacterium]|nr:galactokinase [Acidimicrobiia bacterium]
VSARARADERVVARSNDITGIVELAADATDDPRLVEPAWGRAVGGVLRVLADLGRNPVGADLQITSTVPIGAGLSSSAAFEVAVARALNEVAGFSLSPRELALAAQRAEHVATGVPCGTQDQLTSVFGKAGHALLIDCRTLEIDPLPLPHTIKVLVVHSGVPRILEGSPYAERRAESEAVATRLGVRVLRDATPEQVEAEPRGRHVVSEMLRVRAFADALRAGDLDALGPLMLASHASSRDDMDVSIPELDALVDCLMNAGALGARLTGAGFGGCVVALVPSGRADAIASDATATYRARVGREPTAWIVQAAEGAGPIRAS